MCDAKPVQLDKLLLRCPAPIHRRKASTFSRGQVRAAPVVPSGCDHSQFVQDGETTSSVGSARTSSRETAQSSRVLRAYSSTGAHELATRNG
jgi:hypothetical protein